MISSIDSIGEIKLLFREYLDYSSQFFEIHDHEGWCAGALKSLRRYPIEDDWCIFVIRVSDIIIGFALVNTHLRFNKDGFAIAEFYIQKEYQRKGNGRKLAEYVFAQFPGNWEVAVALENKSAIAFWKKVLASYTDDTFAEKEIDSFNGYGFVFDN